MGKITIHIPQSIQIEYTLSEENITHRVLDMLNALLLRKIPKRSNKKDEISGLFSDEPELIDQIVEQAMQDRMVSVHVPPSVKPAEADSPPRQGFGLSTQSHAQEAEQSLQNTPKREHNKGEWLGLFSDQPELMDLVIDGTQKDRDANMLQTDFPTS